jgi:hypothetical protein
MQFRLFGLLYSAVNLARVVYYDDSSRAIVVVEEAIELPTRPGRCPPARPLAPLRWLYLRVPATTALPAGIMYHEDGSPMLHKDGTYILYENGR